MSHRPIEFVPPAPHALEHFARVAYRELHPETYGRLNVMEFASFMKAVSSALAKDLTRKSNDPALFDNGIECE